MGATLAAALTAAAAVLLGAAGPAWSAPEPEPVPSSWELDFRPRGLRVAAVPDDRGVNRLYLYLVYDVTNFSGSDRLFAPSFDLLTDKGRLLRSGRDVPREVTETIISRLEDPLIEDQLQIVSTILQGREHARTGAVVWPVADIDADEVRVFAAGFSGENTVYFTRDPGTGERVRHVLRKTRMLTYDMPGEVTGYGDDPLRATTARWVMR